MHLCRENVLCFELYSPTNSTLAIVRDIGHDAECRGAIISERLHKPTRPVGTFAMQLQVANRPSNAQLCKRLAEATSPSSHLPIMSSIRAKKLDLGCFVNIKIIRDHTKRKVYEQYETERYDITQDFYKKKRRTRLGREGTRTNQDGKEKRTLVQKGQTRRGRRIFVSRSVCILV